MRDYIPSRDADLLAFSSNFSGLLTATPTDYGVTSDDATDVSNAHTAYDTALTLATDPSTRTASTVAGKDEARSLLEFQIRGKAKLIQAFPSITALQLTALGLTVRDTGPTPIAAPSTKPVVTVETITTGSHGLRIVDEATPTSRSKPEGAKWCEVFVRRNTTPPGGIGDCVYAGPATRFLFSVSHDSGDNGKTAYYLARWVSAKGDPGPTSNMVSATIAA